MVRQFVRLTVLSAVCTLVTALAARGDCCAPACCAPAYRTVCCTEWHAETYQAARVSYHTECRQEAYTAYRCEYTPEVRTRTVTCCKMVPEVHTEWRTYCVSVPCCEQRTVMQPCWTCKPCVHMVCKCEDHGHWECREVCCKPSLCDHLHHLCHHSCCDDCCPPPTKTVRVWVPCKVTVQVPVTTYERVCEYHPVTVNVTTCRQEMRREAYQVTSCRMVPECHAESYTVMVPHQVAVPCTRTVQVCVPHTEVVTCTRMVPCTVTKQVPVCCESSCCH